MTTPARRLEDVDLVIAVAGPIAASIAAQWYEMGGWRLIGDRAKSAPARLELARFADALARDVIAWAEASDRLENRRARRRRR